MKKLTVLFLLVLLAAGTLTAQISRGGTAWVSARSIGLKSSTWFFASTRGTVEYGAEVSVLQVSGSWAEVRVTANSSLTGWIAVSNLSAKRIVPSSTGSSATTAEVAQAGKGFNQEVENAYRSGGSYNYDDVDKTERLTVTDEELLAFIREGRLTTGENR